jgi:hypothetical protein
LLVVMDGAVPPLTVSVAVVPPPPMPLGEEVTPVGVVLTVSGVESVTLTPKVHDEPAGSDAPDKLNELVPFVAVTVPEQLLKAIVVPDT